MSFEEAAALGTATITNALALYEVFKFPLPLPRPQQDHSGNYVFIYGGSTTVGTMAIQFAKL